MATATIPRPCSGCPEPRRRAPRGTARGPTPGRTESGTAGAASTGGPAPPGRHGPPDGRPARPSGAHHPSTLLGMALSVVEGPQDGHTARPFARKRDKPVEPAACTAEPRAPARHPSTSLGMALSPVEGRASRTAGSRGTRPRRTAADPGPPGDDPSRRGRFRGDRGPLGAVRSVPGTSVRSSPTAGPCPTRRRMSCRAECVRKSAVIRRWLS